MGGDALGKVLAEAQVLLLVLNACRSAHADPPQEPEVATGAADDSHAKVRALGSLAHEIMETGTTAVVAMRYNVYVETAAQFMADLYGPLAHGYTVGEAVTAGRKQLDAQPMRSIAFDPRPLQDWPVPVVFEAAPLALFPRQTGKPKLTITLGDATTPTAEATAAALPPPPDAGFFGRDETLLALDRAFDTQPIVLLHAWAGSGKTTTAAEFARWYSLTGGVEGAVLFTTFEQYKALARVLDAFGSVFQKPLEGAGVHWLALDNANRRAVALQVMEQMPLLWIWDNVEPVAGFPAGTTSKWSAEEQKELADFLRAARDTKAKFLLTSRRDERGWLGDLPARVQVPPMPFQERVQLARELARKHGRPFTDVQDWRPLLEFTQGNPLTITVLVGQALRDGLKTREQVAAYVDRLRKGEAAFKDEKAEGRNKSLGASLSYGFESAFSEMERKRLALLHLFRFFVHKDVIRFMGNPEADWHVPELRGITDEQATGLLDRAAEIGLLSWRGGGYYSLHPALPWFFKRLFDQYYSDSGRRATRAFVHAMDWLGHRYSNWYAEGKSEIVDALAAEEGNLTHAVDVARRHAWLPHLNGMMQGLNALYRHTGSLVGWADLVESVAREVVDPTTGGPLGDLEEDWSLVTEYRAELAARRRNWAEAERLQRCRVEWHRRRCADLLAAPLENLDASQRQMIHSLLASIHGLAEVYGGAGNPKSAELYNEVYELAGHLQDQKGAAAAAFNIGKAHTTLPELRDLNKAEGWYKRSLDLHSKDDRLGRARCLGQLGSLTYDRFLDAVDAERSRVEAFNRLDESLELFLSALELFPTNAVHDLGVTHSHLGNAYGVKGNFERASFHYQKSIAYKEASGNLYGAAEVRANFARVLGLTGRLKDAKHYAVAALRGFQAFRDRASREVTETFELVAGIERSLGRQESEPRNQK